MKRRNWNEDTRVKLPATIHFLRLGYDYQPIDDGEIDFATKIYLDRFKPAMERINGRSFSLKQIKQLLSSIDKTCKNNDLGKEFYRWLTNPLDKIKLIDFDNIDNNDFAVVDELAYTVTPNTEVGSFRPDINILINGIPLAFLEVKKPNNEGSIQKEFDRMVNERLENDKYNKFFNKLQLVTFSNNMEYEDEDNADPTQVKAGSFYTTPNGRKTSFSFFREDEPLYHLKYPYKAVSNERIKAIVDDNGYDTSVCDTPEFQTNLSVESPCNKFITSMFDKERFLYLLHYGMMFLNGSVMQKHIMRYPQFFASRAILKRIENGGKGGIIWHTQGSGKTELTAFCNGILRDYFAKRGINARFFYVVDRLSLLTQVSGEMVKRDFNVINCDNRKSFARELDKPLGTKNNAASIGDVCVVNIQKFIDESGMPQAKNDYNAKVQRIFFVDEAHRSYSMLGSFFKNLMLADPDGIFIALTGTPILTKKERSNLKFGDYIHKYFYDKSIADGYTLRIKKEQINTQARAEIRTNLHLEENQDIDTPKIYESDDYVNCLCKFINTDFKQFRLLKQDTSIGGMIVCHSNPQAIKVQQWFEKNSVLKTGLVITNDADPVQAQINKNNQIDFKETDTPDMLVVNMMLTTGYDVNRLKKMYLLRASRDQTLLQTISRVNRPYKAPNGKVYKFGYITDFVDISKLYNEALSAYIQELEEGLKTDDGEQVSLSGLVVDKEDIHRKYESLKKQLVEIIPIGNKEEFSRKLSLFNLDTLHKIARIINEMRSCQTELLISGAKEYYDPITDNRLKDLAKATKERISFQHLSVDTVQTLDYLDDENIVKIIYSFFRTKIEVLDLGKFNPDHPEIKRLTTVVRKVQSEIKKNKDKDDIKIIRLNELLKKIFERLNVTISLDEVSELTDELQDAYAQVVAINKENDKLAAQYGDSFAFVKTYKDLCAEYPSMSSSAITEALGVIYESLKGHISSMSIQIQGKEGFVAFVKSKVTIPLVKRKIYPLVKSIYNEMLERLYTNIQRYR